MVPLTSPEPRAWWLYASTPSPTTYAAAAYESCGFEDKGEWTVHYPALGDIQVAMYELAL